MKKRVPTVPKYRLSCEEEDTMEMTNGQVFYRIVALRDLRLDSDRPVHAGDKGGFVEKEYNLSHEGECWVYDNALVCDLARVMDDAVVCNHVRVEEAAMVGNRALVSGETVVRGASLVCGNASVGGVETIIKDAIIIDNAVVENSTIGGNAYIGGTVRVIDKEIKGGWVEWQALVD